MNPEEVARFHVDQIKMILAATSRDQNLAWGASVESAIRTMEVGSYARIFPKRAAQGVLERAMLARQAELMPNNRWHIASLVESLATLRILKLQQRAPETLYTEARSILVRELPHLD